MSSSMPASVKGGPTTTNAIPKSRYNIWGFLILYLSALPVIYLLARYINNSYETNQVYFYLAFPFQILFYYLIFFISSLIWGWVFLKIVNLFHRPYEGVFKRDIKDKNYRYWVIRANIKRIPLWVAHNCPFPWLDILAFKAFGCKVPMSTALFDAWVDTEFLEIGKNTTIGQGCVIITSMMTSEHLIIKRVRIGNRCLVGSQTVVMPGTIINDDCIVGAMSITNMDQNLESGWLYFGRPAEKSRKLEKRDKDNLTAKERASKEFKQKIKEYDEIKDKKVDRSAKRAMKKAAKIEEKMEKAKEKADIKQAQAEEKQKQMQAKADKIRGKVQDKNKQDDLELKSTLPISKNRLKSDYAEPQE